MAKGIYENVKDLEYEIDVVGDEIDGLEDGIDAWHWK